MKANFLVVLGIVAMIWPQAAAAKISGCFERVYDKAHIKLHVGQMVRTMQLQIGVQQPGPADDEEDGDEDSLAIRLVDRKGLYYANVTCSRGEDEAECRNDATREKLRVSKTGKGVKIIFGTPITFNLEGEDKQVSIPNDDENQTYALVRVSDSQCTYFDR